MSATKVVLRADVEGLGRRGDIVSVAAGYARNFLIPRGLGFAATPGVQEQADAMRRKALLRDAKDREAAEAIAQRLVPSTIVVVARAGEGGRLFGSVTQSDIVAAVAKQTSIELDRKAIQLPEHIKSTGAHQVQVRLHADVEFPLTVEVNAS